LSGIIRQVFDMGREIVENLDAKVVLLNLMKVDGGSFV
jgi:hypothetical protein